MHFRAAKTGNTIHTKTSFWEFLTKPYDQIPEQIAHKIFDPNARVMAQNDEEKCIKASMTLGTTRFKFKKS